VSHIPHPVTLHGHAHASRWPEQVSGWSNELKSTTVDYCYEDKKGWHIGECSCWFVWSVSACAGLCACLVFRKRACAGGWRSVRCRLRVRHVSWSALTVVGVPAGRRAHLARPCPVSTARSRSRAPRFVTVQALRVSCGSPSLTAASTRTLALRQVGACAGLGNPLSWQPSVLRCGGATPRVRAVASPCRRCAPLRHPLFFSWAVLPLFRLDTPVPRRNPPSPPPLPAQWPTPRPVAMPSVRPRSPR
jgi:hypothetical protein